MIRSQASAGRTGRSAAEGVSKIRYELALDSAPKRLSDKEFGHFMATWVGTDGRGRTAGRRWSLSGSTSPVGKLTSTRFWLHIFVRRAFRFRPAVGSGQASDEPWRWLQEAVQSAASWPQQSIESTPVAANQLPTPFEGRSLGWFPKQFGPGDIDGVGAKRLLGTPNIDPAWVLVRETAQNSWDARGASPSIDFILNLRLLEGPVVETLRRAYFTGDPPKTGLAELLRHDEIWALEVSDRGTVGLGGPIRNDLAVDPGIDTTSSTWSSTSGRHVMPTWEAGPMASARPSHTSSAASARF